MNMVSLLIIGLILPYDKHVLELLAKHGVNVAGKPMDNLFWGVIVVGILGLIWAVWQSKRETKADIEAEQGLIGRGGDFVRPSATACSRAGSGTFFWRQAGGVRVARHDRSEGRGLNACRLCLQSITKTRALC